MKILDRFENCLSEFCGCSLPGPMQLTCMPPPTRKAKTQPSLSQSAVIISIPFSALSAVSSLCFLSERSQNTLIAYASLIASVTALVSLVHPNLEQLDVGP